MIIPQRVKMVLPTLTIAIIFAGCGTGETKRIALDDTGGEIGTALDSQDFRTIVQEMSRNMIVIPQIQRASSPPRVAFVSVENRSDDYIDQDMFLNKIRTELIKHAQGRVIFLDSKLEDVIKRETRAKKSGRKTASDIHSLSGADFFLTGIIESITRPTRKGHTAYYRLSFRLTEADTSIIVWENDYELKKASVMGIMYR